MICSRKKIAEYDEKGTMPSGWPIMVCSVPKRSMALAEITPAVDSKDLYE